MSLLWRKRLFSRVFSLFISKLLVTYLEYFCRNILYREFPIYEIEPKSVTEVQTQKISIQKLIWTNFSEWKKNRRNVWLYEHLLAFFCHCVTNTGYDISYELLRVRENSRVYNIVCELHVGNEEKGRENWYIW